MLRSIKTKVYNVAMPQTGRYYKIGLRRAIPYNPRWTLGPTE